jgi:tRNA A-37 threonylcarbamoyl transferase component Bud32
MVLTDRQAADLRKEDAVRKAYDLFHRNEMENRHQPGLGFRRGLREAAHGLKGDLIALYAELDDAGEPPLRDELVKLIGERIIAFIRSCAAGVRGNHAASAEREAMRLIASYSMGVGGDFNLAVHARLKQSRAGSATVRPLTGPEITHDGRYSLHSRLGEGTMGEVWRASDQQLKRDVAIKFVTTGGDQDALAHARALARVNHANIVAVYEVASLKHPETQAVSEAVVMELVDGTPLVELITPTISPPDIRRIGRGLLDALDAYHSAGLAHLDVHDGNVVVSEKLVKVLDPLYCTTVSLRSTATRDKQQGRDIRDARDILIQMLHAGAIPRESAHSFERATARPTLDLLSMELERALETQATVATLVTAQGIDEKELVSDVGETREAYIAWFVEVRSWLQATFGFGRRLEATGDPIAANAGTDPEQSRRLTAAKLRVLFLDGDSARKDNVTKLSSPIGFGGAPKPATPLEQRTFGRRITNVALARLEELDKFQDRIAQWLSKATTNSNGSLVPS